MQSIDDLPPPTGFNSIDDLPPPQAEPTSAAESAVRGGIQGLSLGFGDEIQGAGQAALDKFMDNHPDQSFAALYRAHRDMARAQNEAAQKAHPLIYGGSMLAGGLAPALLTGGSSEAATAGQAIKQGAALGATMAAGSSNADLTQGDVGGLAKDTAIGAGTGAATAAAAPYIVNGIKGAAGMIGSGMQKVAGYLGDSAEDLAVKATGATGKQAAGFAENTGRELLDRKIVGFGNDPAAIGDKAQAAMDAAEASKQSLIQGPLQGAKVDRNMVLAYIRAKIAALKGDESQVGLVKALQDKASDIEAQIPEASSSAPFDEPVMDQHIQDPLPNLRRPTLGRDPVTGRIVAKTTPPTLDGIQAETFPLQGEQMGLNLPQAAEQSASEIPIEKSEQIRRGFDKQAKWDSNTDAPTREASGMVANAYRQAGEDAANSASPELGAQFKADKSTQSLLIPVQEAAEKRALQLRQSPQGGLLDITATAGGAGVGALVGGPVGLAIGATAGFVAKTLRPRYASMGAVTTDWISKAVAATPSAFGKFATPLLNASARGPAAVAATHYVLQQTDPEYRETLEQFRGPADEAAQ